ncbi:MAG TPA: ATP-dependent DNA ligase, partial [Mycobacteriales bacterium]|nr:ATP-dependent DNA ligase [Mycobacteriales bacterium]
ELRQGALEGVMVDAVARAAGVPLKDVRRALMLRGDLGAVAAAALAGGADALTGFRLEVGRPVLPMLAQPADGVEAALTRTGLPAAVEWKLDGARIQVHRHGSDVAVYTRSLDDITARVPEVVEAALALPLTAAVLDGEAIALRPDGRPQPFQVTASRIGSRGDPAGLRAVTPLTAVLFDVLHLDGADLLEEPGAARQDALAAVVPPDLRVPRVLAATAEEAAAAFADAIAHGHEGVVVKSLHTPYEAGRRGAGWLKVKPRHTLDLVVLAVERGHGRRTGWLSNLHLGARDPAGGFVMLGKTFKGLTDAMLRWQTERLGALAVDDSGWVVRVRPELVVEVAFDGVQTSPRYPGGVALRFARVLRYREDKTAAEADTIDAVRAIHAGSRA